MRIRVVRGHELGAELQHAWHAVVERVPALASPYFRPEFISAVAAVRRDVCVGVMEQDGVPIGFLPFQRMRLARARPVGGPLSDHQGVIAAPEVPWTLERLLPACGISLFEFDHVQADQAQFGRWIRTRERSPLIELRRGYEAYAQERRAAGSTQIKKTGTLRRKLEREVGALRFEVHESRGPAFETLLGWKSRQYRRSGLPDLFSYAWTVELLSRIRRTASPDFAGLLSTLYAGDRLVAAHFGMRSRTVWHYWFPAYDEEFGKYSPGLVLLLLMAEEAPGLGITTIDLGKGPALYKDRLANGEIALGQGRVELPSAATALHRMGRRTESWLRRSRLFPVARVPGRMVRELARKQRLR